MIALQTELTAAEQERHKMALQLEAAEKRLEDALQAKEDLDIRVSQMKAEIAAAREREISARDDAAQVADERRKEVDALQADVAAARRIVEQLQIQLDAETARADKYKEYMESIQNELDLALQRIIEANSARHDALQQEAEQRHRAEAFEAALLQEQNLHKGLEAEHAAARAQLGALQQMVDAVQDSSAQLQVELILAKRKSADAEKRLQDIEFKAEQEVVKLRKEIERKEDELLREKQRTDFLASSNDAVKEAANVLRDMALTKAYEMERMASKLKAQEWCQRRESGDKLVGQLNDGVKALHDTMSALPSDGTMKLAALPMLMNDTAACNGEVPKLRLGSNQNSCGTNTARAQSQKRARPAAPLSASPTMVRRRSTADKLPSPTMVELYVKRGVGNEYVLDVRRDDPATWQASAPSSTRFKPITSMQDAVHKTTAAALREYRHKH